MIFVLRFAVSIEKIVLVATNQAKRDEASDWSTAYSKVLLVKIPQRHYRNVHVRAQKEPIEK